MNRLRFTAVFAAVCACANLASANSGVQLSLNQYQAGSEVTDSSLIVNPGFESVGPGNIPTGWTPTPAPPDNIMVGQTPDPANLPSAPGVLQNRAAQAFNPGGVSPFNDYKLAQTVTLAPDTDYVLSAYIWSYGVSGPPPHDDLFAGDLAVVELVDPNDPFNSTGLSLEPTALDGAAGSRGYFVYKYLNSSQFPTSQVLLEVEFDPNQNLGFQNRPALSAQFDNVAITPLTQFVAQRWTNTTSGNWTDPSQWVNGPANSKGAIASFNANLAGGVGQVNQSSPVTVGAINFAGNGTYLIQGG
ncbi:MAG: hypothetical protein NZ561_01155, partial [Phycisphaerae bacterium]|nr:hypothetical protein [Phycisphaerae bacterium]